MSKRKSSFITNKGRFNFVHLFEPYAFNPGEKPEYRVSIMFCKDDKAAIDKISGAVEEAVQRGISELKGWNGSRPRRLDLPLHDGDEQADKYPEYEGMVYLNCKTNNPPGIVDRDRNDIIDSNELYSGCYGRVSLYFFPYDNAGKKGVGVRLNNVQKLADGERLGGGATNPDDDFADDYEDEEDDF